MSSRFARPRGEEEQRTTSLELFYDLVFVFAITQISHHLLGHLTWEGSGQSALLLLVVWWSWNYTAWVTNELDPESPVVRLLMIALMLASLMMAVAIPHAFGDQALLFICSYLAIQVGRHGFLVWSWPDGSVERERAARILIWFLLAGVFWLAGALVDGGATRTILWLVALMVDYGAPLGVYWVPGWRRLPGSTWMVETAHFSERFGLFIIIALGESIVVTGATTSELGLTSKTAVAFGTAFLTSAALWWLYFTAVAQLAERRLHELTTDRTSVARDAYTYLHVVLVGAIVLSAVGDELVIAHPTEPLAGSAEVAAVVGGPALYLFAHVLFRLRLTGRTAWRRPLGAALCVLIGIALPGADALVLALLVLAVLVAVIAGDQLVYGRRRRAPAAPA
ncbi:MAG TPA: low temperature requirement protein A [Baekduia sp.]|uniref:low temperature requirement protein A n=1 Tax=Baekduia sp. TaxID=2600305 RepID=UPI002D76DCC7|nr:low temperature requirement protein A [Baekduia sp.]HET6510206.1 low temperature requirement protein A [Baekduia sp.]